MESVSRPTDLLLAWERGEAGALDRLMPLVHAELRRLARRYMAHERPDQTLQATALVHEAYLRLVDITQVQWHNRAQFFGLAARVMRHLLVDAALQALEQAHPRKAQVVEMGFFGGLSQDEIAAALAISVDTVGRDWRFAKLWLLRELSKDVVHGD
jgi:DNA-directed RNA polymerase specialized sigma24 family protein